MWYFIIFEMPQITSSRHEVDGDLSLQRFSKPCVDIPEKTYYYIKTHSFNYGSADLILK